jgi:hypothetical protein
LLFISGGKIHSSDVMIFTNILEKEFVGTFDVDYDKWLIEPTNMTKYKIGGEEAGAFTYVAEKSFLH